MIIVLSPAKTLNFDKTSLTEHTEPVFLSESQRLVNRLKKMSKNDLCQLMKVSAKIAAFNYDRYRSWCSSFNLKMRSKLLLPSGAVYIKGFRLVKKTHGMMNQHLIKHIIPGYISLKK